MTDENYQLKPLDLPKTRPGSLKFSVKPVRRSEFHKKIGDDVSTISNNNATIIPGFVPIIDDSLKTNNNDTILSQFQKDVSDTQNETLEYQRDSLDVFYETSPLHYGFEEIKSLQASQPILFQPLDNNVEITKSPIMTHPLAPYDSKLDLLSIIGQESSTHMINHMAPLCIVPDLEPNKVVDGEYHTDPDDDDNSNEENYELRLLHILDYEFDNINPKPLDIFKSFYNWIKKKPDYYERYPWCKFIQHSRSDPLDFDNFNSNFKELEISTQDSVI